MTWDDRRIMAALDGASAVVERLHDALRPLPDRLRSMLTETTRTDAVEIVSPYSAARTSYAHKAIALYFTLGALCASIPWWAAILLTLSICAAWEYVQNVREPGTRTLRDSILFDGGSYLVGSGAIAYIAGDLLAGRFWEWLQAAPSVVLYAGIVGITQGRTAFSRVPEGAKK
jgi:hypothetical protein